MACYNLYATGAWRQYQIIIRSKDNTSINNKFQYICTHKKTITKQKASVSSIIKFIYIYYGPILNSLEGSGGEEAAHQLNNFI